jgi:hypothetical protein
MPTTEHTCPKCGAPNPAEAADQAVPTVDLSLN